MVKIKIPATSANLGSGFDCLGVAVNMYNEVEMEQCDKIDIQTLDEIKIPTDENNLIYKTSKYLFDICGEPLSGIKIRQKNRIPMARGLGSSSACIVAGLMGANTFLHNPLSKDELINIAADMEGHPDNSTPAFLGGMVSAVIDGKKVYYVKTPIKEDLKFVAFIPNFELKTSKARAVVPNETTRKAAVYNTSRSALMGLSIASGNYGNMRVACKDMLHQNYRLPLIKGGKHVFKIARELDAYATYISGAGSTIMSIIDESNTDFIPRATELLEHNGMGRWKIILLDADNKGASVEII